MEHTTLNGHRGNAESHLISHGTELLTKLEQLSWRRYFTQRLAERRKHHGLERAAFHLPLND